MSWLFLTNFLVSQKRTRSISFYESSFMVTLFYGNIKSYNRFFNTLQALLCYLDLIIKDIADSENSSEKNHRCWRCLFLILRLCSKIYYWKCICNVNCRFSALAVNFETQPVYSYIMVLSLLKCKKRWNDVCVELYH